MDSQQYGALGPAVVLLLAFGVAVRVILAYLKERDAAQNAQFESRINNLEKELASVLLVLSTARAHVSDAIAEVAILGSPAKTALDSMRAASKALG